jgi:hypothetical protein
MAAKATGRIGWPLSLEDNGHQVVERKGLEPSTPSLQSRKFTILQKNLTGGKENVCVASGRLGCWYSNDR